jgi:hypothetical protein
MNTLACLSASLDHPTPIRVTYRQAPSIPGRYHGTRYVVSTADGETLCTARTPFYSAARALVALGHHPLAMLYLTPEGTPNWSLRGLIGKSAKLTVRESETVGPVVVKYDGERLSTLNTARRSAAQ